MLMRAVSGLMYPTSGTISIDGKVLGKNMAFPEKIGMLIGIVMIAVLARIVYLNHCYPSPKVITYTENDTIKLGNYEIKQTGWEQGR